ncbi:hypothetical protein L6452_43719 [Arctium lappa]|uniref:Uncharacterized protein n=1 Tax=Arctium lappa TaxID=4217 RepID=A0ACB8XE64_ARCLA|nr:hypothetical protein L6452_43719 [Arctium lappa]
MEDFIRFLLYSFSNLSFPHLSPTSDLSSFSLTAIDGQIEGPDYEKGVFKIKIQIPERSGIKVGYRVPEAAPKDTQPVAIQPIVVPALQLDELEEITNNFCTKSLIVVGSYARVYHGVLRSRWDATIKELPGNQKKNF